MSTSVVLTRIHPQQTTLTVIDDIPTIVQNAEKQFYNNAIHRLIRKLDRRVLPFLLLLEMSSYINRVSIGHAKLMGTQTDLHLSDSESSWAISLFYLAYVLFVFPSNLLLRVIGATLYLSLSMLAWGSITVGMAFATNARQLLIIRFLLSAAQAGYFPSIIIYFSRWYCKREQTMRIALIFSTAIASGAVDGILAYGMQQMKGMVVLKGWQWMFLLEGSPIILLGIITYLFLDNVPNAVQWLNNIEKQLLTNLLRNDAGVADSDPTSTTRISWRQVRYVFIDWRIYLYALIAVGDNAVIRCLTTFLPSLVEAMGYSNTETHLMTAPPYAVACVCCLLVGYSSSCRNEHGYHLAFCLTVGLLGFILMLTLVDQGKVAMYVSTIVGLCGTFSALSLILSWLTNNVGGHTKRAMAISFVIGTSQIGGIIMPLIYREADKPTYRRGHLISSGMLTISLVTTIILRIYLMKENHRRTYLSLEEYQREAAVEEPCDWHPNVRYVL